MDVVSIIYGLAVGLIALVGLYKAYANDQKITMMEIENIIADIKEMLEKQSSNSSDTSSDDSE